MAAQRFLPIPARGSVDLHSVALDAEFAGRIDPENGSERLASIQSRIDLNPSRIAAAFPYLPSVVLLSHLMPNAPFREALPDQSLDGETTQRLPFQAA